MLQIQPFYAGAKFRSLDSVPITREVPDFPKFPASELPDFHLFRATYIPSPSSMQSRKFYSGPGGIFPVDSGLPNNYIAI
jgi:hypothetical protein